jgi:hypothetical protein
MLLVQPNGLIASSVKSYLIGEASFLTHAFVYGGPNAVSVDIAEDVAQAMT